MNQPQQRKKGNINQKRKRIPTQTSSVAPRNQCLGPTTAPIPAATAPPTIPVENETWLQCPSKALSLEEKIGKPLQSFIGTKIGRGGCGAPDRSSGAPPTSFCRLFSKQLPQKKRGLLGAGGGLDRISPCWTPTFFRRFLWVFLGVPRNPWPLG